MTTSLDSALVGMLQQQRNLELIANNLANVNTVGYKRASVRFQDVLDTAAVIQTINSIDAGVTTEADAGAAPSSVEYEVIERSFTQGALQQSDQPLDMAISGRGFFRVTREDGTMAYSRDGGFRLDGNRQVVTFTGERVDPPITFPEAFQNIRVYPNGVIVVRRPFTEAELAALPEGAATSGVDMEIGRVGLTTFNNLVALTSVGNNLYVAQDGADPLDGFPGDDNFGVVRGGFLEASNVDIAREMAGLVIATRVYQLNVAAYKTIRDMLDQANDLLA